MHAQHNWRSNMSFCKLLWVRDTFVTLRTADLNKEHVNGYGLQVHFQFTGQKHTYKTYNENYTVHFLKV